MFSAHFQAVIRPCRLDVTNTSSIFRIQFWIWKLKSEHNLQKPTILIPVTSVQSEFIVSNSQKDVVEKQNWNWKDFAATKSDYR